MMSNIPEDVLLTDEEFFKLHEEFFGEGSGSCCEIDDTDLCYRVAKAQVQKMIEQGWLPPEQVREREQKWFYYNQ